jgi:long-chain acyl-CoA synthetase
LPRRGGCVPESVVLHTGAIVFNGAFVTLMPCFYLGARYILQRQFDPDEAIEIIAASGSRTP